jgi:hypothetical protein
MTIEYLADQAVLMVSGGRPSIDNLDKREVRAMVREALPVVARQEYFENYKAMNQSDVQGQWLVPFQIAITTNSILGLKQMVLPEPYISLPKNRGVNKVQMNGKTLAYMNYDKYELLKGGALLEFYDNPSYSILSNTILLLPVCAEPIRDETGVVVLAVANSTTLTESQGLLVLNHVVPLLRIRMGMPADMITDQNPNVK